MLHSQCPCCQSVEVEPFFTISNAPTQSLVTIKGRDEALKVPRKDIVLTFCNTCGFIYNSEFDTTIDYFTQGYEDQQGFSQTFMNFLTGISERFIDKYDMRNKKVLEVGCGKGDYLKLFCKVGHNHGIGVDPAWEPGRCEDVEGVDFLKEIYSEDLGNLEPDCITCRHTLEHIHDPMRFMATIRRSVEGRTPIVFLEVPSVVRILEVQAFWDIFYEHCSYFSPGSLARLFRQSQLEVLDMFLDYDDQYLFVEALPVQGTGEVVHSMEESIEDLKQKVQTFVDQINLELNEWRTRLNEMKAQSKKVVVWGGGSKSVGFLTQFDDLDVIAHVCDINPHMQGNYIPGIGKQYVSPAFLEEYKPDVVIVMNSIYMEEIRKDLAERGLHPEMLGL